MSRTLIAVGVLAAALSAQGVHNVSVACCSFLDSTSGTSTTTITVGTTVRWNLSPGANHTVTSGTGGGAANAGQMFDASLNSGTPTFQFTFNSPGTFPYFCRPHDSFGMHGTVIVRVPASATSTGTGCAATGALTPLTMSANGLPQLGNANFAVNVANGLPNNVAQIFLAAGLAAPPIPVLPGCTLYLDPLTLQAFLNAGISPIVLPLNGAGAGSLPLPIPNTASLQGVRADLQAAVISPNLPNGAILSNALTLILGA